MRDSVRHTDAAKAPRGKMRRAVVMHKWTPTLRGGAGRYGGPGGKHGQVGAAGLGLDYNSFGGALWRPALLEVVRWHIRPDHPPFSTLESTDARLWISTG
jgi:hypothetical protein